MVLDGLGQHLLYPAKFTKALSGDLGMPCPRQVPGASPPLAEVAQFRV